MNKYSSQSKLLAAIDCIIFGFDGQDLKILLIRRGFEPARGQWSLMGGFVKKDESLGDAAARILKQLTGLEGIYLEQLFAFGEPKRDPIERTISVAYFALIDIHQYEKQLSHDYHAEWFNLNKIPKLIFDHTVMVERAKEKLRYKAGMHPILFELLPAKFTIPQLQILYEGIYSTSFDKRNFSRKLLSTGLLIKQKEKDKINSKKGAYYYKLDKRKYEKKFQSFLNIIPNSHKHW
ncbi:MAG TPA: NUDIX domain-containing protein [Chitinophagaceae bacterium]|jgi:ADP-ribose pyrophosphatase YjhB (NUDIX family)|nr:NUDIX domain-containing protein [Chitinophagaceae bacterium]